tara:strand:- start:89 stop:655 length:567 start_codon:yes stop_codon:yes gene_type:complete
MAIQLTSALKGFFNTGDQPSEGNFADLIDSCNNTDITVSNATSADVDLTSVTSSHKLFLTGTFAADVILPQATAANAGIRIDVFCTVATGNTGTIRIGFTNAGSTVMTGGITLVSTGANMDSIGIHTAVNNSKVLLLDSDNAALCGGLEGSRYSFFYQEANKVFVEAIGHTSAATPALSSATSATGIS